MQNVFFKQRMSSIAESVWHQAFFIWRPLQSLFGFLVMVVGLPVLLYYTSLWGMPLVWGMVVIVLFLSFFSVRSVIFVLQTEPSKLHAELLAAKARVMKATEQAFSARWVGVIGVVTLVVLQVLRMIFQLDLLRFLLGIFIMGLPFIWVTQLVLRWLVVRKLSGAGLPIEMLEATTDEAKWAPDKMMMNAGSAQQINIQWGKFLKKIGSESVVVGVILTALVYGGAALVQLVSINTAVWSNFTSGGWILALGFLIMFTSFLVGLRAFHLLMKHNADYQPVVILELVLKISKPRLLFGIFSGTSAVVSVSVLMIVSFGLILLGGGMELVNAIFLLLLPFLLGVFVFVMTAVVFYPVVSVIYFTLVKRRIAAES